MRKRCVRARASCYSVPPPVLTCVLAYFRKSSLAYSLTHLRQGLEADELREDALATRRQAVVEVHVKVRPLDTVELLVELDRLGHVDGQLEAAGVHQQPSPPNPLDRERVGVGRLAHGELDLVVQSEYIVSACACACKQVERQYTLRLAHDLAVRCWVPTQAQRHGVVLTTDLLLTTTDYSDSLTH